MNYNLSNLAKHKSQFPVVLLANVRTREAGKCLKIYNIMHEYTRTSTSKCIQLTTANSKLLPAQNMVQQIFHLKWRQVEQVFRRFFSCADQRSREFSGHHLLIIKIIKKYLDLPSPHNIIKKLTVPLIK